MKKFGVAVVLGVVMLLLALYTLPYTNIQAQSGREADIYHLIQTSAVTTDEVKTSLVVPWPDQGDEAYYYIKAECKVTGAMTISTYQGFIPPGSSEAVWSLVGASSSETCAPPGVVEVGALSRYWNVLTMSVTPAVPMTLTGYVRFSYK